MVSQKDIVNQIRNSLFGGGTRLSRKQLEHISKNITPEYKKLLKGAVTKSLYRYQKGLQLTEFDSVVIEITRSCNYNCPPCYNRLNNGVKMGDSTLEKVLNFSLTNSSIIFWSGGEPFLDGRILETAKRNQRTLFYAFTNGSLLSEKLVWELKELGNLFPYLGIEGSSEEVHDGLRQNGSYKTLWTAIERLHQAKVPWLASTIVNASNFKEVISKEFFIQMQKYGAVALKLHHYFPAGENPNTQLMLKPEQEIQLEKRVEQINSGYSIPIIYFSNNSSCKSFITFDVEGNIKICPYFHYTKRNINELETEKIPEFIDTLVKKWKTLSSRTSHYCPFVSNPQYVAEFVKKNEWRPTGKPQAIITEEGLMGKIENDFALYKKTKISNI